MAKYDELDKMPEPVVLIEAPASTALARATTRELLEELRLRGFQFEQIRGSGFNADGAILAAYASALLRTSSYGVLGAVRAK